MAGNTVDLFGAKGAKQALDLLEEARVGVLRQAEEAQGKLADTMRDTAQLQRVLLESSGVVRYPTDATRAAAEPPDGTWGWAADVDNYRHRETGRWVSYDPAPAPADTGVY